jgi:glycosyltransferase involved in cell wall biosynthesis
MGERTTIMNKILWLSHFVPYPPKGGNLQRSYNLIKELSKQNEVTLLTFNQSKIIPTQKLLDEAILHLGNFCKIEPIFEIPSEKSFLGKITLLLRGMLPWRTYTISWLESENFQSYLYELIEKYKFDVIHCDTISLVPCVKKIKNVKIVLNHHNIESLMMLRRAENEKNILKKFYFWQEGKKLARYERKVCGDFDLNITCSELDSDRLVSHTKISKCETIPNGVDLDYFNPVDIPQKPRSLIFVGGLSWYPNLDAMTFFLKQVWPLLHKEVEDVSLTIIGRSPPDWMIEMQAIYPSLKVMGFVDDIRSLLSESYLYVCPIKDGGGTKLKVLDALAMKKALVADPIACEGIDVKNGESVMFASTPREYIEAIKSLIANQELKESIEREGRRLIEKNYSFASIGARLSLLYKNLECH